MDVHVPQGLLVVWHGPAVSASHMQRLAHKIAPQRVQPAVQSHAFGVTGAKIDMRGPPAEQAASQLYMCNPTTTATTETVKDAASLACTMPT